MTEYEAIWLIKTQLARTTQNLEAVKVLEKLVKEHYRLPLRTPPQDTETYTLDEDFFEVFGTEAQHVKNHMKKVGEQDLKKYYRKALSDFAEDE
jgi:hypothetical protein